ncbi:MAG TPA: hypothetical protein VMM83_02935 [Longimicrobiales bacterium]|nr:hypothetical protein [Longimicrobiales bacterium]
MNGVAMTTEGQVIVLALACLSLILLVLAGWLGRWSLWVVGWTVAMLALAAVLVFREPADVNEPEPERESTLIGMNAAEERRMDPGARP